MKGTACITGASSGIGRAYAMALAETGYRLIVTGRRHEKLQEVVAAAEQLRKTAGLDSARDEVFVGDLADPEVCAQLAARIAETTDLDFLIHNAGFGHQTDFSDTSPNELRAMGEVHMQCAVVLAHAALPRLMDSANRVDRANRGTEAHAPAVLLVSSVAAFAPAPGPALYTATKALGVSFGRAIHPAAARTGVRVQVVCPGFTHTGFHDRLGWSAEQRRDRGIVRWMTAAEVVRRSLHDLGRPRGRLWRDPVYVPGGYNRLIVTVLRWMPRRLYGRLAARSFSLSKE